MKKYTLIFLVLVMALLLVACQRQVQVTEELLKETFEEHNQSFTYYADRFTKQDLVQSAEMTFTRFGTRYYTIRTLASAERPRSETTFKVPAKFFEDDEDFWENDPGRIISTKKTGEMTLRELFKIQKMTALDFHIWRHFLRNNSFFSIGPAQAEGQVEIRYTKTAGYIYCPVAGKGPVVAESTKLVKLTANWYYFIEG